MTMEYSHLSNKCGEGVKVAKLLNMEVGVLFWKFNKCGGGETFLINKDDVSFFQTSISVEGGVSIQ